MRVIQVTKSTQATVYSTIVCFDLSCSTSCEVWPSQHICCLSQFIVHDTSNTQTLLYSRGLLIRCNRGQSQTWRLGSLLCRWTCRLCSGGGAALVPATPEHNSDKHCCKLSFDELSNNIQAMALSMHTAELLNACQIRLLFAYPDEQSCKQP